MIFDTAAASAPYLLRVLPTAWLCMVLTAAACASPGAAGGGGAGSAGSAATADGGMAGTGGDAFVGGTGGLGGQAGAPAGASRFRFAGPASLLREPLTEPQGMRYFVDSTGGDDKQDGRTEATAWKSPARLGQAGLMPGDVVSFRRGSEFVGGFVVPWSGAEGKPIVFRAYGEGDSPLFRNPGVMWGSAIKLQASWVILDGLVVRDAMEAGVFVDKTAHHNLIRNVEATAVGTGFNIRGTHNVVAGGFAHDLTMVVNTPGGDDDFGAVGFHIEGSYNEIAYSRCERCRAPSQDYGMDGGVIELYGNVSGTTVHHVWGEAADGFVEIGGGRITDTLLAYNVSYDNYAGFACLHTGGKFGAQIQSFVVEHNTIVSKAAGNGLLRCLNAEDAAAAVVFRNNIVWSDRQPVVERFAVSRGINLFGPADITLGFAAGEGDRIGDPEFVNESDKQLALRANSPARDAAQGPPAYRFDHADVPIPSGGAPELGAFEIAAGR